MFCDHAIRGASGRILHQHLRARYRESQIEADPRRCGDFRYGQDH